MPESKITSTKINWSNWIIIGSSITILLIITGIIRVLMLDSRGILDTTTSHAVLFISRYIALPLGLLGLISGINDFKKGLVKKKIAITEILVGIPNIFIGLISWIYFFMILAFVAAF